MADARCRVSLAPAAIAAGTADKRIMRQHYWLHFRLEPFDKPIPENWRQAARERQLATSGAPQKSSKTAALPSVGRWILAGPVNIPGRCTGLSRPGGRPGWIMAAMADGGAWLTRDAGATWEPLTEREATQASGAVLGDPLDPETLYWGTGEETARSTITAGSGCCAASTAGARGSPRTTSRARSGA